MPTPGQHIKLQKENLYRFTHDITINKRT